jgi:hypothetical protein
MNIQRGRESVVVVRFSTLVPHSILRSVPKVVLPALVFLESTMNRQKNMVWLLSQIDRTYHSGKRVDVGELESLSYGRDCRRRGSACRRRRSNHVSPAQWAKRCSSW